MFTLLFLLAFLVERNRTYCLLFYAAVLNMILYPFTSEYSVALEAGLDLVILLCLVVFADKHRVYQLSLLLVALFCHFQFELDQATGGNLIFTNYGSVIIGLTIMQLLGALYGVLDRLLQYLRKSSNDRSLYSSSYNRSNLWPKG